MAELLHPEALEHAPYFIAGPDQTDQMFVVMTLAVIGVVIMVGIIYFRMHALPERMAHGANSSQFQLVGVMALLALFTHNNIFWVLALLLAAFKIPDFNGPLADIADAIRGKPRREPECGADAYAPDAAHPAPGQAGHAPVHAPANAPAAASTATAPAPAAAPASPYTTGQERGDA